MRLPRPLIVGPLLAIAGLVCWALYVRATNTEHHSYAHGGNPPTYVKVEAGTTYGIAIHGGVGREGKLGLEPGTLQCTAARHGEAPSPLELSAESVDTKATDRIGSFVSNVNGEITVQCSGIWLVFASVLLAIGLPLTLSGLRRAGRRVDPASAGGLEFGGDRETRVVGAGPGYDLHAEGQSFGAETERDLGRG
jgi:hypothetical protein